MNQYMSDSSITDFDPRELVLDPILQARDPQLISNNKDREAQIRKQALQDKDILEELLNGGQIRLPITVFEVGGKYYVVDGFHRTRACLAYLTERPTESIKIKSKLISNRTYTEAFLAAQEVNQGHGVGVTRAEVTQSKFRALIVNYEFDLSVSELENRLVCSRGQANHASKALKACREVLGDLNQSDFNDLNELNETLRTRLTDKYSLTDSTWDSVGFPKIRKLADAHSGKNLLSQIDDSDSWFQHRTESATADLNRMMENYGPSIFREALRKAVRGHELGISVTRKDAWEKLNGYNDESEYLENADKVTEQAVIESDF